MNTTLQQSQLTYAGVYKQQFAGGAAATSWSPALCLPPPPLLCLDTTLWAPLHQTYRKSWPYHACIDSKVANTAMFIALLSCTLKIKAETEVQTGTHLREQGLKGVAYASFAAATAWTARAETQPFCRCLPLVGLAPGTAVANPVAYFHTSASDYIGVQTFFGVQFCIPEVHDWMWAVNQHRMSLPRL